MHPGSFLKSPFLTNQSYLCQITSKLSPITSYEDAVEGLVTHGFISSIEDFGIFVTFYNNVRGLAHR